ncbi:hypothetical protein [Solidesulfovibrio carbinolicus]|uniref:Autotransporter domain-containing protein n=1 Tax=Solidesulfovibrio carbinolicus TaxID=296842 RepID=A0A4V0YQD6_9BACT|nr:hypothetical protein [Solidesulfovibrio carbinolicus]QAZ65932.1 hypothetical protein C3Y92_01220 [Solidesulfovibrio carbinolicus]
MTDELTRENVTPTGQRGQVFGPWLLGLGLLLAALLLAVLGEARAADEAGTGLARDLEDMNAAKNEQGKIRIEAGGGWTAPQTVSKARFSMAREEARAYYETDLLALDMGFETGQYDFTRTGRLPFGGRAPFKNLSRFEGGLAVQGGLWSDVSGFLGLRGDLGYEDSPDLRGLGGTAMAGLVVPMGRSWLLTLGGGASLTPVDVQPVPIVALRYEAPADTGIIVNLGLPRTEASWRGGSWWTLRLTGELDGAHYHLADDNPAAPQGTAAFFAPRAGLFVDLTPMAGLKASLGAHYALPGTMTFYRESGSQLKRYDTGGAPGASLRLGWSF